MTRRSFLRQLDVARVEAAVATAEAGTTGEIRVSIAGFFWGSSPSLAERAFVRLGMNATRDRNGVLLLVLPWRRQLVVRADSGIDARAGHPFWEKVVAEATSQLRAGNFTEALVAAVATVGAELRHHFPCAPQSANVDELPNKIDRG